MDLTEARIDALEPQRKRLDIAVETDLVLSVLPNGIKTWAHVYEHQGQLRRKTLGVYPDMNIREAQESLIKARKTLNRLKSVAEHAQPTRPGGAPAAANRGTPVRSIVAIAIVLSLAGAWFLYFEPADRTPVPPVSAVPEDVSEGELPAELPERPRVDAMALNAMVESVPGESEPDVTDAQAVVPGAGPAALPQPAVTPERLAEEAPGAVALAEAVAADEKSLPGPAPVPDIGRRANSDEARARRATETRAPVPAAPAGAQVHSNKVARVVLTSEIANREPLDTLGPVVYARIGEPGASLYFFTEVRGMNGAMLTHRWQHEGTVVSQRDMRVGAWRWRLYSSKDILPGMEGSWTASLLDADGEALATFGFELHLDGADTAAHRPD